MSSVRAKNLRRFWHTNDVKSLSGSSAGVKKLTAKYGLRDLMDLTCVLAKPMAIDLKVTNRGKINECVFFLYLFNWKRQIPGTESITLIVDFITISISLF